MDETKRVVKSGVSVEKPAQVVQHIVRKGSRRTRNGREESDKFRKQTQSNELDGNEQGGSLSSEKKREQQPQEVSDRVTQLSSVSVSVSRTNRANRRDAVASESRERRGRPTVRRASVRWRKLAAAAV